MGQLPISQLFFAYYSLQLAIENNWSLGSSITSNAISLDPLVMACH